MKKISYDLKNKIFHKYNIKEENFLLNFVK
jgi:hypothetical protein